jgi:hypothetical protein
MARPGGRIRYLTRVAGGRRRAVPAASLSILRRSFFAPPRWPAVPFFNKANSAAGKRFIYKPLELPMQQKILIRNHEYLAGFANVKGEDHEYECQQ